MKHRRAVLGVAAAVALGASSLVVSGVAVGSTVVDHVTICHRTNSNSNPYVQITPDVEGVLNGHAGHTGPVWDPTLKAQHIKWGDIIPPFVYAGGSYPGMNWSTAGQAIYNNDCNPVTPPPPPVLVDLSVEKAVVGTVPGDVEGFTAHVTCDDGTDEDVTLPVAGGAGTPSSIEVEQGSQCSVVETATGGANTVGYSIVGIDVPPGVFIDDDATVTITNTFDPPAPPTPPTPPTPGPAVSPEVAQVSPAQAAVAPTAVAPTAVSATPHTTG